MAEEDKGLLDTIFEGSVAGFALVYTLILLTVIALLFIKG